MSPITWFAIYMTIWWPALFAVLPLGSRSFFEAGIKPPPGVDPGVPVNPNLKRKFITTTWVSAVVFLLLFLVLRFNLIRLPDLPMGA